ncbi:MAG: hypothetical protein Edafosvirus5_20 [Edafosvirus sp.]|uniref:DUF2314 domain-containing protein n=1 Tax=Edafosvirus sp. TaxID=2487765 RepID=A0A3G4ZT79_9VIRU|nr:MAG: hypothetical protein Edafosvirus5_20 [Edafosvirus sp.]
MNNKKKNKTKHNKCHTKNEDVFKSPFSKIKKESDDNMVFVKIGTYDEFKEKLARKPLSFFLNKEVKVKYDLTNPITRKTVEEWMWTHVLSIDTTSNILIGKLMNQPFNEGQLKYGDIVTIKRDEIGLVNDNAVNKFLTKMYKKESKQQPHNFSHFISNFIFDMNRKLDDIDDLLKYTENLFIEPDEEKE